jgi:hypothetical protein
VSTSHTYIYVSTPPCWFLCIVFCSRKINRKRKLSTGLQSTFELRILLLSPPKSSWSHGGLCRTLLCLFHFMAFCFFSFSNFRAIIFFQVHVHRCLHIQRTATVHTPFKDWVQQRLFLLPSVTLNRKLKNDGQGCWSSKKRYCYCLGGNKLASIIF